VQIAVNKKTVNITVKINSMAAIEWCYYSVPAGLGVFGLVMTLVLRRCMKDEPTRMEKELQEIRTNPKL